jgi:hypothetical protein
LRVLMPVALAGLAVLPTAVRAECVGPDCYDGLGLFLAVIGITAATFIAMVVQVIRGKMPSAAVLVVVLLICLVVLAYFP